MMDFYDSLAARLRASGDYVWPLALRLILAGEFWESGTAKLHGKSWFEDIPWADWQKGFPWPFSVMPQDLNWLVATWGELVCSVLILLGLFTRFAAISLVVVTAVVTAAVHWPAHWDSLGDLLGSYLITARSAGNFKLPVLYVGMLLPLVFYGGGRISCDHLLLILTGRQSGVDDRLGDVVAFALACLVLAVTIVFVEPSWGLTLLALSVASLAARALMR